MSKKLKTQVRKVSTEIHLVGDLGDAHQVLQAAKLEQMLECSAVAS